MIKIKIDDIRNVIFKKCFLKVSRITIYLFHFYDLITIYILYIYLYFIY